MIMSNHNHSSGTTATIHNSNHHHINTNSNTFPNNNNSNTKLKTNNNSHTSSFVNALTTGSSNINTEIENTKKFPACSKHIINEITFHCLKCKSLFCTVCLKDHQDHKEELKVVHENYLKDILNEYEK